MIQKMIPSFPPNWPFLPTRQQYFLDVGYTPMQYTQENIQTTQVLLLVTPVLCGDDNWVSPEWVWRNYLLDVNPTIKVIQAGWDNSAAAENYLHWNRLPGDFSAFLQTCKSVGDGWVPHWTYGDDLREVWTRFRDGHDKGGFMDWFIVARRRAGIISRALAENGEQYTEMLDYLRAPDSIEAFGNLVKRWHRYETLLQAAPCVEELTKIAVSVAHIERGWEDCQDWRELGARMKLFAQEMSSIEEILDTIAPLFKIISK